MSRRAGQGNCLSDAELVLWIASQDQVQWKALQVGTWRIRKPDPQTHGHTGFIPWP